MEFINVLNSIQQLVQAAIPTWGKVDDNVSYRFVIFDTSEKLKQVYNKITSLCGRYPNTNVYYIKDINVKEDEWLKIAEYRQRVRIIVIAASDEETKLYDSLLNYIYRTADMKYHAMQVDANTWLKLKFFRVFKISDSNDIDIANNDASMPAKVFKKYLNSGNERESMARFADVSVTHWAIEAYNNVSLSCAADNIFCISTMLGNDMTAAVGDNDSKEIQAGNEYKLFKENDYPWVGMSVIESTIPELLFLQLLKSKIKDKFMKQKVLDMCQELESRASMIKNIFLEKFEINETDSLNVFFENCKEYIPISINEDEWEQKEKTVREEVEVEKKGFLGIGTRKVTKEVERKDVIRSPLNNKRTAVEKKFVDYILREYPPEKYFQFLFDHIPCICSDPITEPGANQIKMKLLEITQGLFSRTDLVCLKEVSDKYCLYIDSVGFEAIEKNCGEVLSTVNALLQNINSFIRNYSSTIGTGAIKLSQNVLDIDAQTLSSNESELYERMNKYFVGLINDTNYTLDLTKAYDDVDIKRNILDKVKIGAIQPSNTMVQPMIMNDITNQKMENHLGGHDNIEGFSFSFKDAYKEVQIKRYPCTKLSNMINTEF